MSDINEEYDEYDKENIFFIIKYLLRSKSLVDAIVNVPESDLKKSLVDKSTIVMTTVLKLSEVLTINDRHWDDNLLYDLELLHEYLDAVTKALTKNFMSYIQTHEPQIMMYLVENNKSPRIKVNMTEFEIEFGSPLTKIWNVDEDNYFMIRYGDMLETFK